MKRVMLVLLCGLFTLSMATAQETKKKDKKEKVTFVVDGMDCANCVKKVEKNIAFEKGVTDLKCDLPTRTVAVSYRSDKTSEKKLVEAFKKIGMEAKAQKEGEKAPAKKDDHDGHDHSGHKH